MLVAQVVSQRKQVQVQKHPGGERASQLLGNLDAPARQQPLLQVGVLREVVEKGCRDGRLTGEYRADSELEQGQPDAAGNVEREEVQDSVRGKTRQVQDAGDENRGFRSDLPFALQDLPDLFLRLGKLVTVEMRGDVPVQGNSIGYPFKYCIEK